MSRLASEGVHAEGYVFHSYGPERYLHHVVAALETLRRHDDRPAALYAPEEHLDLLESTGLVERFAVLEVLPEAHQSIVGFKHHLHRFAPFERSLLVDADMVWCRDPDPLWQQLRAYSVTATGLDNADVFFGAPKGLGVVKDVVLRRRARTLRRFGLTHLPRVQSGMVYVADRALAQTVSERAQTYLAHQDQTHFQSRLNESGRTLESCEWSLAMAFAALRLPLVPWHQGYQSPQLDYLAPSVTHDPDFEHVVVEYPADRTLRELYQLPDGLPRRALTGLVRRIPPKGDVLHVTPFALHFGWLRWKQPFEDYAARTWARLTS